MPGSNRVPKTIKKSIMKTFFKSYKKLALALMILLGFGTGVTELLAQDTKAKAPEKSKPALAKNTFEGNYLIDNQTVIVPVKGTFQADIQHRFGTVENGIKDLYGLFASANMRLGVSYVVVDKLQLGFGASNDRMQVDGNLKYALLKQTKSEAMPVSVSFFGNMVMDTRAKSSSLPIVAVADRFSFFSELMIARKFSEKFSVQVAPTMSYFNNVEGYFDEKGIIQSKMNNMHLGISFAGRYKLSGKMSLMANYDQPLTQHPMNNPHPNISIGLDFITSGHEFQIFAGNYGYILPQNNNMFNQNDFTKGQYLIGFNISRLWNF